VARAEAARQQATATFLEQGQLAGLDASRAELGGSSRTTS
jgi:hypothetical protein